MNLKFITGNENKFEEAKKILSEICELKQLNINLDEIQTNDSKEVIRHKLQEAKKYEKNNFFVEDNSLELKCLNGFPGPLIKWMYKSIGIIGIHKICKKYEETKASAIITIGYLDETDEEHYFEGIIEGTIVSPRGENGFIWDHIFMPEGCEKTYAEMTKEEKNQISPRKLALEKLKEHIQIKEKQENYEIKKEETLKEKLEKSKKGTKILIKNEQYEILGISYEEINYPIDKPGKLELHDYYDMFIHLKKENLKSEENKEEFKNIYYPDQNIKYETINLDEITHCLIISYSSNHPNIKTNQGNIELNPNKSTLSRIKKQGEEFFNTKTQEELNKENIKIIN
ncbi:non-canonical purine NTP pyrophosphatase [Candidatus Woesearchaeota archaeon]|nr:non-canonical purine NTP pyrophosphatase [Candidatus Woesearchaeota archaeon]MCF8013851.1 non-canonical purine NTP pyrophosphatase [Candidatus Woesearchaeota archaeon]